MPFSNIPTLDKQEGLELALELLSFSGGENTIGEDQAVKANEARICQNWTATSLGGMKRENGFSKVAENLGGDDADALSLLHMDGDDESTTITDDGTGASVWTAEGNAKLTTATKKFGTASLSLDGTNSYISTPYKGVDPYTKMLLHGQGVNGAQTFLDAGTTGHTLTPNGSVYTSSNHAKFGGTSMWFRPANALSNGSFETGTPPTGWTALSSPALLAQSNEQAKFGTYSLKLTAGEGKGAYQDAWTALGGTTVPRGKTVTFGCWIYSASVRSRIALDDGTTTTYSNVHTGGGGWEWLTVTATIGSSSTYLLCKILTVNSGADVTFYADGAIVVYGTECPEYYDGGGTGYLTAPDHADFDLGASDFDIEANAYFTDVSTSVGEKSIVGQWEEAGNQRGWKFDYLNGNLRFVYTTNGSVGTIAAVQIAWTPITNTPYHLKASRVSNKLYFFANGVLLNSGGSALSATIHNGTSTLTIGASVPSAPEGFFSGFLSELRIRKGVGVSTAFTPQTTPYVNGFWTPTGDFTIEGWVNFAALPTNGNAMRFFFNYQDAGNYIVIDIYNSVGTYLLRTICVSGNRVILNNYSVITTPTTGYWNHWSFVRNIYTFTTRVNGVTIGTPIVSSEMLLDIVATLSIGNDNFSSGSYLNGSIDEFRYSDVARYTADFTPQPFAFDDYTGQLDLLKQHKDTGGTEVYAVVDGDLVKKSTSYIIEEDVGAFTSGVLCHSASNLNGKLWITNSTDGLKMKAVGVAIATPADVPPTECDRIYIHKNRLIAEGSLDYPFRIYGSRTGVGNWTAADAWTLSNDAYSIDLPEETTGCVPNFPSGSDVLVFTKRNAYAIYNFPSTAFRAIGTPARGCSAPYSIALGDEGVYFLSSYPTAGVFLFDGTSFAELTEFNKDVFIQKIDLTKRVFGFYKDKRYYLIYNEIGSGATYPDRMRIFDTRYNRWFERPISSLVADNFGYPAMLQYSNNEFYVGSSRSPKMYDYSSDYTDDAGQEITSTYKTKDFSSRDFAVASGGQFPIDDVRMKLEKMVVTYSGTIGNITCQWTSDRGLHSGGKIIDLTASGGDLLNSTFIMNTSSMSTPPLDKTRTYTFPNGAVGTRFNFQLTNTGSGFVPEIKKIKITAIALNEA